MANPLRIGVLTAGGDCPGLNACIRAIVRSTISLGGEVCGIPRGYAGLLAGETMPLDSRAVGGVIHLGGTLLRTARCAEMVAPGGVDRAAEALDRLSLTGLVVVGGNGGLRGAWELAQRARTPVVGVPKTIDNDVGGTDLAIGFDSGVNTAMQAVDRIRDTARSHDRIFLIEVMGRDAGHLAAAVGVAAGAEVTLVPEIATTTAAVSTALQRAQALGKLSCIVVVAEGWGQGAQSLAADLIRETGYEIRVAILGHVQRGGPPTALDRVLASQLGARAVDALHAGERTVLVAIGSGGLVTIDLATAWRVRPALRADLFALSRRLAGVWPPAEDGP